MHTVVVGLGKTGASCVRFLARHGERTSATDSRAAPPGLAELGGLAAGVDLRLGGFDLDVLEDAAQVLISPGVSLDEPIARVARERGIAVLGDVELFARHVQAPVVGITGTNGKSTVTTLVAHMAQRAGRAVLAGGNLGDPVLDLLERPVPDLYVLELSSFQLETTSSLSLLAAVVLNVTADHMDRYASVEAYATAKARIFRQTRTAVINDDDPLVAAMREAIVRTGSPRIVDFSITRENCEFSLLRAPTGTFLARRGEPLLELSRMKIAGRHNAANALAALALGEAVGLPMPDMLAALESFTGLPHRCEWVAELDNVRYVNDSKGTNVGATIAAVAGMEGPLVLIAGGDGKGQDFTPLAAALRGKVHHTVLIGKDAAAVAHALAEVCATELAGSMQEAVMAAARAARPGDTVLLSPACASLDMFRNYEERGAVFTAAVRKLNRRNS